MRAENLRPVPGTEQVLNKYFNSWLKLWNPPQTHWKKISGYEFWYSTFYIGSSQRFLCTVKVENYCLLKLGIWMECKYVYFEKLPGSLWYTPYLTPTGLVDIQQVQSFCIKAGSILNIRLFFLTLEIYCFLLKPSLVALGMTRSNPASALAWIIYLGLQIWW